MHANDSLFPFSGDVSKLNPQPVTTPRGIHVRDWVATCCLQGILANERFNDITNKDQTGRDKAARLAYEFADALIKVSE
jgi:hypothetical protein